MESEVEVLAPSPFPLGTVALGALAGGALLGVHYSPERHGRGWRRPQC